MPQSPTAARTRLARLVLAGMAAAVIATPALAQGGRGGGDGRGPGGGPGGGFGGMGGFGGNRFFRGGVSDMMRPTITKESIAVMEKMLNLSPDQKRALQEAYTDYEGHYNAEAEEVQARMERSIQEARDSGDPNAARGIRLPVQEFRTAAGRMDDAFLGQFKAMLTAEQKAKWPAVERAQRRDQSTGNAMMTVSGERVDLVKVLDKISLSPEARASLAPLLAQYEEELDKELIQRKKVTDEVAVAMSEMRFDGDMMQMRDQFQAMQRKMQDAGAKVAEINRRYTARIQASLPEDRRPGFTRAVKEARFADIYRPSSAGQALAAAAAFDDLDAAQKSKLQALRDSYSREVTAINDKLAAATEQAEANPNQGRQPGAGAPGGRGQGGQGGRGQGGRGQGGQGGAGARGPGGGGPAGGTFELRRDKTDLDRATTESLRAILTPAQQEKLPRMPERPTRGPGGQEGGGRGGNRGG